MGEPIAEDRRQESLDGYDAGLMTEPLDGIEAVAMWKPSIPATRERVPEAAEQIVVGRFHVMGPVGKAVDTVRTQEHQALMASGDETLKGSTYLWQYSREDGRGRSKRPYAACGTLCTRTGWTFWKRWYFWAPHSRLGPIRKAAETVRRHIENILTYYRHPVTNAMSEGLNSQIQKIKSMACGFRNIEHFKTAIDFPCGGLDLYPCETRKRRLCLGPGSSCGARPRTGPAGMRWPAAGVRRPPRPAA